MAERANKKRVGDVLEALEALEVLDFKKRQISDERQEIPLHESCRRWEEQPLASRPLVFFTVGKVAILSSSSGVPEVGSLCRQFWAWLGQKSEEYEPTRIKLTMVNGEGLHMSLPDLTYFEVKLKQGPQAPLESVITLSPKNGNNPQNLTAKTIMTQNYTPTPFSANAWLKGKPEVLIDIEAVLKIPGDSSEVEQAQMYVH